MDEQRQKLISEMRADKAFMKWLAEQNPDWESEYSGHLLEQHAAWLAGMEHQRYEDRLNSDNE